MSGAWAKFPHSTILHYTCRLLLTENNGKNNVIAVRLCAVFVVSWWRNKGLHILNRKHNEVWGCAEIWPVPVLLSFEPASVTPQMTIEARRSIVAVNSMTKNADLKSVQKRVQNPNSKDQARSLTSLRSDEGLTLETSVFDSFTVDNLPYRPCG